LFRFDQKASAINFPTLDRLVHVRTPLGEGESSLSFNYWRCSLSAGWISGDGERDFTQNIWVRSIPKLWCNQQKIRCHRLHGSTRIQKMVRVFAESHWAWEFMLTRLVLEENFCAGRSHNFPQIDHRKCRLTADGMWLP
jgi:hypothetical protein